MMMVQKGCGLGHYAMKLDNQNPKYNSKVKK